LKKTFLLLISIFCIFSISATDYGSNSLGQIISSSTEDCDYVLTVEENTSRLYRNNALSKEIITENDGEYVTLTTVDSDTGETQIKRYKNNLLQSVSTREGVVSYIYEDSCLIYRISSSENGIDSIEYYLRSPVDYSLIGVKRYDEVNLYSETMVISEDKVLYSAENLFTYNPFRITENNEIVTESDEGVTVYNLKGQMVRKETENTVESYEYNETGALSKVSIKQDSSESVYFYVDNEVSRTEEYKDGVISYIDEFNLNGYYKVRRIFRYGKHIANAWYEENSVSASEIEYVKE